MKKRSGFTFVELLLVVTIIAILTGVAMVSYTNVSRNSRDSRRRLDIENIRSALELCRTESGSYPASVYDNITCDSVVYLADTPKDPKSVGNYSYNKVSDTSYTLSCVLESGEGCSFANP